MKILKYVMVSLIVAAKVLAQTLDPEKEVRQAVRSFYDAFNAHAFENAEAYTNEDWNHINPFGGWTRGCADETEGSAFHVSKRRLRHRLGHGGEVCHF
jgi:hypothetical protein